MMALTDLQGQVITYILQCLDQTGMPPTLREIAAHFEWRAVGSAQDVVNVLRKKGFLLPPNPGKSRQLVPTSEAVEWWAARTQSSGTPSASRLLRNVLRDRVPLGLAQAEMAGSSALNSSLRMGSLEQPECLFVPVIGLVQAGSPIEAIEHARTTVPFLNVQKKSTESDLFAVAVDGYSMMNVGFLPGDFLLVESATSARNGDIVVAAVGDHEVTVKRFAMRGSQLYRQAHENLMHANKRSFENLPPALLVPENNDFAAIPFGLNEADKIIGLVRSLYRQDVN
jgi:repressor LexA